MKITRIILFVTALLAVLSFGGCQAKETPISGERLAYPGTEWNMSPDEVKAALGLTEDMCVMVSDTAEESEALYQRYAFRTEQRVLGEDATVVFVFMDYVAEEYFGLQQVYVYFHAEADHASLLKALEEQLGTPAGDSMHRWNASETITIENTLIDQESSAAYLELYPAAESCPYSTGDSAALAENSANPLLFFNGTITQMLQWAEYGMPE